MKKLFKTSAGQRQKSGGNSTADPETSNSRFWKSRERLQDRRLSMCTRKVSLEHWRLLADLTFCYKIIHGLIALDFNDFFTLPVHPGLRGHSFKLTVPIVKCNRSKYFFSSWVVPVWNALPAEVVIAPNIFAFKKLVSKVDLSPFLIFACIVITWFLCFFTVFFLSNWLNAFLICLCVF